MSGAALSLFKPDLTLRSTRAFQTVVMPLRAPKNRPAVILGAVALVVGGLAGGFWLGRLGPHRLVVASVPPGARILRGGQEAGLTPLPLALQSGDVLQLEKVGFHPMVFRYQAGDPPPMLTLEPILTDEVIRTSPNRAVVIMDSVRLGGLTPIVVKGWDQSRKHDLICILGEWVMSSTFNPGEVPGGKVLSLGSTAPAWKATGPRPAPPRSSAAGTVALAGAYPVRVKVDGRDMGEAALVNAVPGNHLLELSSVKVFFRETRHVFVNPGERVELELPGLAQLTVATFPDTGQVLIDGLPTQVESDGTSPIPVAKGSHLVAIKGGPRMTVNVTGDYTLKMKF